MSRLKKGDLVPDLIFHTQDREFQHIYDVLEGTTIFWVLRYIGCTVCRFDVEQLIRRYGEFQAKGAQVYVVMQSGRETVRRDLEGKKIPFEIICDEKQEFYQAFDVEPAVSKEQLIDSAGEKFRRKKAAAAAEGLVHGDYEGDELQLPAVFFVDESGGVLYAKYGENITDVPTIDEMLAML